MAQLKNCQCSCQTQDFDNFQAFKQQESKIMWKKTNYICIKF